MNYNVNLTTYYSNSEIRHEILHGIHTWDAKDMVYLVTGTLGPTGKTWLVNQLKAAGLRAIDTIAGGWPLIKSGRTTGNYMLVDEENKVVYISLNDFNDVYLQNNDCML